HTRWPRDWSSDVCSSDLVDGNGDGVRTADITKGIDRRVGAIECLPDNYVGVDFGLLPGLPPLDPGGPAPGSDPIKLGNSDLLYRSEERRVGKGCRCRWAT